MADAPALCARLPQCSSWSAGTTSGCPHQLVGRRLSAPHRTCQYLIDRSGCSVDRKRLVGELIGTTVVAGLGAELRPLAQDVAQAGRNAAVAGDGGRFPVPGFGLLRVARPPEGASLGQ